MRCSRQSVFCLLTAIASEAAGEDVKLNHELESMLYWEILERIGGILHSVVKKSTPEPRIRT